MHPGSRVSWSVTDLPGLWKNICPGKPDKLSCCSSWQKCAYSKNIDTKRSQSNCPAHYHPDARAFAYNKPYPEEPRIVSKNINRLTLAALVWRVALVRAINDIGRIIKPLTDIIRILPENRLGPSAMLLATARPTQPARNDPSPFMANNGTASLLRNKTKLSPSDAAAVSPHIAPQEPYHRGSDHVISVRYRKNNAAKTAKNSYPAGTAYRLG